MLALFIGNKNYSSWSLRPWLAMKQLGIPFDERLVPFGGTPGAAGFAAVSPSGKVPCLLDGMVSVWDSLAIVEYLAEAWPDIWPADRRARAWARCAAAEMHSGFHRLRDACTMNCGLRVQMNAPTAALRAEWARIDALWTQGLARFGGPFLAGAQFSAVDAFFAPVAFRVQTYMPPLSADAQAYAQRLLQLEPMQDWYRAALAEVWRDEAHEAEARAAGLWLQDLRVQTAVAA